MSVNKNRRKKEHPLAKKINNLKLDLNKFKKQNNILKLLMQE